MVDIFQAIGNIVESCLKTIKEASISDRMIELQAVVGTLLVISILFKGFQTIVEMSNIEAIKEKTDAIQNNKSSADLVLSIKTGSAFMYIGITITCIAIIGAGAYIIKKKVLNKGI